MTELIPPTGAVEFQGSNSDPEVSSRRNQHNRLIWREHNQTSE